MKENVELRIGSQLLTANRINDPFQIRILRYEKVICSLDFPACTQRTQTATTQFKTRTFIISNSFKSSYRDFKLQTIVSDFWSSSVQCAKQNFFFTTDDSPLLLKQAVG